MDLPDPARVKGVMGDFCIFSDRVILNCVYITMLKHCKLHVPE